MTTSNSVDFTLDAEGIISEAFKKLGIRAAETPLEPFEIQDGLTDLNLMLKSFQSQGLHLWTEEEGVLFLDIGKENYLLGPTGDEATTLDDFVGTTLTSNQITNDTIINLSSTAGMTGPANLFGTNPLASTAGWIIGSNGIVSSVDDQIIITNGVGVAGFTDFSLVTIPGQKYIVELSYIKGTSAGAIFSVQDGATILDTTTLTASGDAILRFTAVQNSHAFRFKNTSVIITEDSILSSLKYVNTSTGDKIGIELDDKTRFWDNIAVINSSSQVELNNGLPSDAASGSTAFTFTKLIDRPLRISSSRRKTFNIDNEIHIESWSRSEYFNQVNKASQGTIVNAYYSPLLTNGRYYVWQTASSLNDLVRFSFERPIQDIDLTTETVDIPVEWLETVIYNLAARLSDTYDAPPQKLQVVLTKAAGFLAQLTGWDEEIESINIQPDLR